MQRVNKEQAMALIRQKIAERMHTGRAAQAMGSSWGLGPPSRPRPNC
jgi:hypothetical protein